MKIALLMSGEMRTIDQCVGSLREHVIDPLRREADVCLLVHAAGDGDAHKAYEHLGDAADIVIEDQPTLDEKNYIVRSGKGVMGVQTVLRQLWEWRQVWRMAERREFDFAVRLRADTLYYNDIEPPSDWQRDTLYVPRFSSFWGVCDRFGYGDREVMGRWHTIWDRLDDEIEAGIAFHPETLVQRSAAPAVIARTDVLFATVRPNGELRAPVFMPELGDVPV